MVDIFYSNLQFGSVATAEVRVRQWYPGLAFHTIVLNKVLDSLC